MAEFRVYIAVSRDGFIADAKGSVDWLEPFGSEECDYGYTNFIANISTLIMGRATFDQVLSFGQWPYADHRNIVLTHDTNAHTDIKGVTFSKAPIQDIADSLHNQDGDVWIMGGGDVTRQFMDAGLVDTMEIFTMPVTLETGIALFTDDAWQGHFTMVAENTYDDGVVHTTYQTQNAATDT